MTYKQDEDEQYTMACQIQKIKMISNLNTMTTRTGKEICILARQKASKPRWQNRDATKQKIRMQQHKRSQNLINKWT